METIEQVQENRKQAALEKLRSELEGKRGKQYWRTLDEVTQTEEFKTWFEDEFPNRKDLFNIDRRALLKFAGASLALAGLTGCRGVFLPEEKLVPYVKAPEELIPGKPLFYASATILAGYATGVLVEQHEGRPVKFEGNVDHPLSLGALDSFSQADILNFYDPDRSQNVVERDDISTWELFTKAVKGQMASLATTGGEGLGLLFGAVTSPTHASLVNRLKAKYPKAKVYSYESTGRAHVHAAVKAVTGQFGVPVYDFKAAKVVVTLDGDFLSRSDNPAALLYARQFADARRVEGKTGTMNRVYSVEANPGLIGASADHRYPAKPSQVYGAACALAGALGVSAPAGEGPAQFMKELSYIVGDLKKNAGASVVVAGEHQPAEVHQLAFMINNALGNVGKTVNFIATPEATAGYGTIQQFAADLATLSVVFIQGANPVFTAPADLKLQEKLTSTKAVVIHHGAYVDETGAIATWHVPMTHSLESWGDARTFNGTVSIVQPIIAPIFGGRSDTEVLSLLLGESKAAYDLVRGYWQSQGFGGADFEKAWRTSVHNGTVPNTALASLPMTNLTAQLPEPVKASGLELSFVADSTIFDGRYANNGWLQELPKPLTKLVWDNVFAMSKTDADAIGVKSDMFVRVKTAGGELTGMAFVLPGQPAGSVTVTLGYGRTAGGTLATLTGTDNGGGFNSYAARTTKEFVYAPIVEVVAVNVEGVEGHLASTQGHSPLGGNKMPDQRDVIREGTLADYIAKGGGVLKIGHSLEQPEIKEANLYPDEVFEWNGDQWGMTIDMNTCIGCGACVTACQAENNISVVGKEQVEKGREMHWIRIDRYYSGSDENPSVTWQPIACVHCEAAPCEPVCPVAATVHSHEGLNQMVYNRCVGTRYCSNNCPYKVRRFNYLNWSDNQEQFSKRIQPWNTRAIPGPIKETKSEGVSLLKMLNNPDVTVRGRGVMEKCTYCVQRINEARVEAKKAGRNIKDGEVVTACQQACASGAIVFGNIADKESRVSKLRKDPRSYLLLEELQTRPRTSHLARLRNPHPDLAPKVENAHEGAAH
jgi:MoCo/4Fe-4S cofactor protein with predicted Tat translocation signal